MALVDRWTGYSMVIHHELRIHRRRSENPNYRIRPNVYDSRGEKTHRKTFVIFLQELKHGIQRQMRHPCVEFVALLINSSSTSLGQRVVSSLTATRQLSEVTIILYTLILGFINYLRPARDEFCCYPGSIASLSGSTYKRS